ILATFFFSSSRRHTRFSRDWSSDVCSSDLASGGSPAAFTAFGLDPAERRTLFADKLDRLVAALRGEDLGEGRVLYPPAESLAEQIRRASCRVRVGVAALAAYCLDTHSKLTS